MYQDTYYVDKSTGTPADALVAHGLAALLSQLGRQAVGEVGVRVRDEGPHYAVELDLPVSEGWLRYEVPGLPFLATGKQANMVPTGVATYDYAGERERRAQYFGSTAKVTQVNMLHHA